ncbi:PIG-L family deacetylase [Candidatus Woesearchaeota archaeon]|nr:PIG-L family deacetylase [Candidatus Woesearchaeota archaeon]
MTAQNKQTPESEHHIFLAPHPDDETICMPASIMNAKGMATLIFVTDGAPDTSADYFINKGFSSRGAYSAARVSEAKKAAELLGLKPHQLAFLGMTDQQVHNSIPALADMIKNIAEKTNATHIHAPCFEGNHPDHDSVRLAAGIAAKATGSRLIEHSINRIRTDLRNQELPGIFTLQKLSGQQAALRRTILTTTYQSQRLSPERYLDAEAFRFAVSDDYSELRSNPELLFEASPEIKVTRQQLLDALNQASAKSNIFK